jgi:hypothetical protein
MGVCEQPMSLFLLNSHDVKWRRCLHVYDIITGGFRPAVSAWPTADLAGCRLFDAPQSWQKLPESEVGNPAGASIYSTSSARRNRLSSK